MMTPEAIRGRLTTLREMDFAGAEKLAQEMATDAREPLGSFARVLGWAEHPERRKAEFVLEVLGALSILPWLAASRKLSGGPRIEALSDAYRIYHDLDRPVV